MIDNTVTSWLGLAIPYILVGLWIILFILTLIPLLENPKTKITRITFCMNCRYRNTNHCPVLYKEWLEDNDYCSKGKREAEE